MKKFLLFALSLGIILTTPSCFAGQIGFGGVYGMRAQNNLYRPNNSNSQYYYRPTVQVTPAMTRNNTVAPTPISCLGSSSYVTIGQNVMPCNSAAATTIKVSNKKNSNKKVSEKTTSKNTKNSKDNEV